MRNYNEATRVQIPALIHLVKLGYKYVPKIHEEDAGVKYDPDTNILLDVFKEQFAKLNPEAADSARETLEDIKRELYNDDLGKSFYKRLTDDDSSIKLIDFEHPENNKFHCTAEFTCGLAKEKGDNFRPDITLFINGLPLVFIEVKKPNNQGGIVAESTRMNDNRFPNKKFRRYINITQLMIFSNNMDYSAEDGVVPIQGAFYCTAARKKASFNCFREENPGNSEIAPFIEKYPYKNIDDATEREILDDLNCQIIRNTPEYQTNLGINTPTNRILTSMCSPERLLFLIKYGIAYVHSEKYEDGKIKTKDEKHIMRYQQMFAALAVRKKLSEGVKSGVIWHTQGSGKTALAFYLRHILSDFYAKQGIITKFYFIVDRRALREQAKDEFESRGLASKTLTSTELMTQFKTHQDQEGNRGEEEIIVVDIQALKEEEEKGTKAPYATNLQRIFIIDEAHRSYKPGGSFLANLFEADPHAIKIALTGTPLLKEERASRKVFGGYIHTYYYDKSIQDGYTLKIIREDIETSYREKLSDIYNQLDTLVQKKVLKKSDIIEHDTYVEELLRYIITDLKRFRKIWDDETVGGMVMCETSEQAKKLSATFNKIQLELNEKDSSLQSNFKAGLVLFDTADNETTIHDFKKHLTVDVLIVFKMLLTGFDAPRLKRLYFGRKLDGHNLLQAITRVNRPYDNYKFGYVVDFADIKKNFDETNEDYLREIDRFNDPDPEAKRPRLSNQILEDNKTILEKMREIRQELFAYTLDNVETFQTEISAKEDKQVLLHLKKLLEEARNYYNVVRGRNDEELKAEYAKVNIEKLPQMLREVQNRINLINKKEAFERDDTTTRLINEAMLDIRFSFKKIREEELKVISGKVELQEKWIRATREFSENIDQEDPQYDTLWTAFRQRFKEHGFEVQTIKEYQEHSKFLDEVIEKLKELKRRNYAIQMRYNGDAKFVRVHKRIREENDKRESLGEYPIISKYEEDILEVLKSIKGTIDQKVYDRNDILTLDAYFETTVMNLISNGIESLPIKCSPEDYKFIQERISEEYLAQYNETYPES